MSYDTLEQYHCAASGCENLLQRNTPRLPCDCKLCERCTEVQTTTCPGCYVSFAHAAKMMGEEAEWELSQFVYSKEEDTLLSTVFSSYYTSADEILYSRSFLQRKLPTISETIVSTTEKVKMSLDAKPQPIWKSSQLQQDQQGTFAISNVSTAVRTKPFLNDDKGRLPIDQSFIPVCTIHPVDAKRIRNMILFNDVPINSCAIGIVGLPHSGKSKTLNALFKCCMKDAYQLFMKKEEDRCFNMYDVCAFGAYPYETFKWSHTTKRFSPVFFILSDLFRLNTLRKLDYEQLEIVPLDTEASIFGDDFLDKHFQFLYEECSKMHQQSIDKALLLEGLSLFNCFDTGVSKAVYDIFPLFAFCFKKLVRFVFYSIDRDIEMFEKPPDLTQEKYQNLSETFQIMKHSSRLAYFFQLASGGYNHNNAFKAMVIGATQHGRIIDESRVKTFQENAMAKAKQMNIENAIDDDWISVDSDDTKSVAEMQKHVEKKIKKNNRLHISVPLKWIFLRSLIASLTSTGSAHVVISFQAISSLAKKLNMNEEEVKRFLITFTDFASLLYCPVYESLAKYVITDIEAFMHLLNNLYHPKCEQDKNGWILKYGVVVEESAKNIFGDVSNNIMDILVSLGLAAKLSRDQLLIEGQSYPNESHFMPNVREGVIDASICQGSLIIRFITLSKTENAATLSQSILTRHPSSKVRLIASEHVNCTKLRIILDSNTSFEIHILYHGKEFELRLINVPLQTPPPSHSIITTCTTIIEGCCKGMISDANFKQGVDFSIGFKCFEPHDSNHLISDVDKHVSTCSMCQGKLDTNEKIKMQWWIAALKKCTVPLLSDSLRRRKQEAVNPEFITDRANMLTNKLLSDDQEKMLKEKLDIREDELTEYHGWELFTMMLIMWGKRNPDVRQPKLELDRIINEVLNTI